MRQPRYWQAGRTGIVAPGRRGRCGLMDAGISELSVRGSMVIAHAIDSPGEGRGPLTHRIVPGEGGFCEASCDSSERDQLPARIRFTTDIDQFAAAR